MNSVQIQFLSMEDIFQKFYVFYFCLLMICYQDAKFPKRVSSGSQDTISSEMK